MSLDNLNIKWGLYIYNHQYKGHKYIHQPSKFSLKLDFYFPFFNSLHKSFYVYEIVFFLG